MWRNPVVTAVAVLSLALGIGSNTAIFSLIDTVMLEKLPAKNAASLMLLGDGVSGSATEIRQAIKEVAHSLPMVTATRLSELVDHTLAAEELVARLATFFGLLAISLASIGIYGVVSRAVAGRTNEMGIRLAFGARPRQLR
jgi:hypothetical protein